MSIIINNSDYMFTVFEKDGKLYMNTVVGGVAQYEETVSLSKSEVDMMLQDENWAIALAADVSTRTDAYMDRIIRPSIIPE